MRLIPACLSSKKKLNDGVEQRSLLYLNVYDLTPLNNFLYWFGLGIFHSGIEVHGMEYGFGAHQYPSSGVFEVEPKSCPGFVFRRSILLGSTDMSSSEFQLFIGQLASKYHGDTYHLIAKNCNHFTDEVCMHLARKPIPGWVNRLARLGSFFNCLLPEHIQIAAVRRPPDHAIISGSSLEISRYGAWKNHWDIEISEDVLYPLKNLLEEVKFIKIPRCLATSAQDGSDSATTCGSADTDEEVENADHCHRLLITPNEGVAFLKEEQVRLAKELL